MHALRMLVVINMLVLGLLAPAAALAQAAPSYNGQDQANADFSGQNLQGASFNGTDLANANLSGAQLQSATMNGADLAQANLTNADLSNADLTGADLTEADLRGATLTGTNLTGADLIGTHLEGVDLSQAVGLTPPQLGQALTDATARVFTGAPPATPPAVPSNPGAPLGGLPASFPLPPGAIQVSAASNANSINVAMSVPDPKAAFAFWQNALPAAGYTVTSQTAGTAGGVSGFDLIFSGNGFREGQIAIANVGLPGSTVAITLQR